MEGQEEKVKPTCKLIGEDSNVFNLIAKSCNVLKKEGMYKEAIEMSEKCFKADNYDHVLRIIMEYVTIE